MSGFVISGAEVVGGRGDLFVDGDRIVGTAPGAAERIDGDDYLVAVQWHPEENAEDRRLFLGLVAAAARYRASRSSEQQGVPA